jgi:hypothetical protein
MEETTFENKCAILSELWMDERDAEDLQDLFNYGDLGFPLAYAIANGIVEETDKARSFVEETFDLLISSYGLEDEGFEDYDDIILATGIDMGEDEDEDEDEDDIEDEDEHPTVGDILEMIAEEKNAWGYGTQATKALEQLEKRIRK